MWFGHGTGPGKDGEAGDDGDDLFGPAEIGERIAAVAQGAIGALPAGLRARAAARNDPATLERLTAVMTAWAHAATLDHAEFAERFLGRAADDPVAGDLRAAAMGADTARSHADLAKTAGHLADAMRAIGLDHWQSFVADAQVRAKDPATLAAVADSQQSPARAGDPVNVMAYAKPPSLSELRKRDDSIRPVYPVETALGVAATGVAADGMAAARAIGAAILRRVLPKIGPPGGEAGGDSAAGTAGTEEPASPGKKAGDDGEASEPSSAAESPSISRQKQDGHIRGTPQNQNRLKQGTLTSTFDGNQAEADALTQEAWGKGTSPPKQPGIRDYDFGRRIGEGKNGGGQSTVRVHQDSAGKIHGHPSGRETP